MGNHIVPQAGKGYDPLYDTAEANYDELQAIAATYGDNGALNAALSATAVQHVTQFGDPTAKFEDIKVGDHVIAFSRNRWRVGLVLRAGPKNVSWAYVAPQGSGQVTIKVTKRTEVRAIAPRPEGSKLLTPEEVATA